MTEINKALEQYYIDTRTTPPDSSDGPKVLQAKALVEKPANVENWRGPYISYKVPSGNYVLEYPTYMHIHLLNLNIALFGFILMELTIVIMQNTLIEW